MHIKVGNKTKNWLTFSGLPKMEIRRRNILGTRGAQQAQVQAGRESVDLSVGRLSTLSHWGGGIDDKRGKGKRVKS